ncbi:MAG: adenylosuccinate synthetase [Planctomycetota bacterium]|nr:MAG: adenylosuccinate synthetase [Planctomycetota bacterium]
MPSLAVVGLQWGDEGKGKVVDALTAEADLVCRYGGGANAGHTVCVGSERFVLHLVPSGILHPDKRCVIGNGVVVDPDGLLGELQALRERGIAVSPERLALSERAHLVMPYHVALDRLREERAGAQRLGTTGRGIGPCYTDKTARVGIHAGALRDRARFERRLQAALRDKAELLGRVAPEAVDPARLLAALDRWQQLVPYLADTVALVHQALDAGERVLFEGAQGALLDVDLGTYPYVTSCNAGIGGLCAGTGVPPNRVDRVLGVAKAYMTRVGRGPMPTELPDRTGAALRERGEEYGATTGRPRRCGWLDLVATRHAVRFCGIDAVCLTKLDVLSGFSEIRVAVAYRLGGRVIETMPADAEELAACEPVYETLAGWAEPIAEVTREEELPPAARDYVAFVEARLGARIAWLSVGRRRDQLICRGEAGPWTGA